MTKKTICSLLVTAALYLLMTAASIFCFLQNEGYYIMHSALYVLIAPAIYIASVILLAKQNYLFAYRGMVASFIINFICILRVGIGLTFTVENIGNSWMVIQYYLFHIFAAVTITGICISYKQYCANAADLKNDTKIRAIASVVCSAAFVILLTVLNNIMAVPRVENYILPVSGDIFIYELISVVSLCIIIPAALNKNIKAASLIYKTVSVICLPAGIIAYYLTSMLLPFQYSNNARIERFNYLITSPLLFVGLFFGVTAFICSETMKNIQ